MCGFGEEVKGARDEENGSPLDDEADFPLTLRTRVRRRESSVFKGSFSVPARTLTDFYQISCIRNGKYTFLHVLDGTVR